MDKIKIAFVITSLEVGGAEKVLLDLVSKIDQVRFEIKVFIIKKNMNSIYDLRLQNINIDCVYLNKKTKIFFDVFTTFKLTKQLKKFKPNIIHSHLKSASFVFFYKLFNKSVKWLHTIHTIASIDTKYLRRPIMGYLYRHKYIFPVAVSESVKLSAMSTYKLKDEIIQVIYNGVMIEDYFEKAKKYTDGLRVLHIGRFEKVKNHRYIIKEFNKFFKVYPMARLNLIGEGPLKEDIRQLVKRRGLNTVVSFIAPTNEVANYYKNADIYILPSLFEGLSLSLIEAMASGCAIIASNVGGNSELIENYVNGYLIDNKPNQLFEKLVYLNNRRDLIKVMGEKNVIKAKEFSLENMVNEYQKIYVMVYEN